MESSIGFDLLRLAAVALLVLANGFFVAAEFSLVSVRRTRIAELVARGETSAEAVQKALENPDRVIAATQLGITIASLGLGWLGEPALAHLLEPLVRLFPGGIQDELSHTISVAIAFSVITFLHVVVGELAPKSIALQDPEKTSLFVARPTLWTEQIFKPAIWLLNGAGNALLRLINVQPADGHALVHSIEELKMIVAASAQGGVVEADESEMLHALFDFGTLLVRQIMIPRTEIIAVEADAPMEGIISQATQTTYTKFPVYEDNLDQILGIVHVKDLLVAMQGPLCENCKARDFVREAIFVPETNTVNALLRSFRDSRMHIAIVMDEFGGTAGMVTLEDVMEEIVGEVSDPFDEFQPEIQAQPDGSVLIEGLTLIEEVNEQLGLQLSDPDYDTIAGYMLGKLGRIPRDSDVVEGDGVRLRVEEMDGMRIARLSLENLQPLAGDEDPASGEASDLYTHNGG
ncbi:MAG TPA: hemolysin family protein [Anaerolineales bacterium]|nr:hemolysin family protein [Anaerolineales bacterium]